MILKAFWEPLDLHLGVIWGPKWLPNQILGPPGTSRSCQMSPKAPLGPPRNDLGHNFYDFGTILQEFQSQKTKKTCLFNLPVFN